VAPAKAHRSRTPISWRPVPRSSRPPSDVWATGRLILKVKEPIAEEYGRMRKDQVLFTYLHLAASKSAPTHCWPR
jgi:hypothetical protein